jgi:hypothetical protein
MRLIAGVASILPTLLAVVLAACAHTSAPATPRIDSSTPEAFHASWKRLNKSLTSQQRSELSLAILPIALGKYKSLMDAPPALLNAGVSPDTIREQIDGMTFAEIVDLAHKQSARLEEVARHP